MPAGRPKKEIDKDTFEKLCGLQCTAEEICDFLNVSDKTLYKWCNDTYGENFSAVYKKRRENGKVSLRRMQWKLAERSAPMAIFLGKNYLGQRDTMDVGVDDGVIADILAAVKDID